MFYILVNFISYSNNGPQLNLSGKSFGVILNIPDNTLRSNTLV